MLNFTVGPVQSNANVMHIGAQQVPYFRTPEFSSVMMENERLIKKLAGADDSTSAVFITGSGTAAMEAAVINTLTQNDKALIINGGSFGQRFAELCRIHEIPYAEIKLDTGKTVTSKMLESFKDNGFTALLVNILETSTGVCYNIDMISSFCRNNGLFLITDAISSFLAEPFDFSALDVDVMITGSQKALACPPGVSIIILSERAVKRVYNTKSKCMYLDLKAALENAKRGQTPFTPAVGILLQIQSRLKEIEDTGGTESEIRRIASIASDFRAKLIGFDIRIVSESLSNAVTPLYPEKTSAYDIFNILKDEFGIWVCPNGGELKDRMFRVGHIGNLTPDDNDTLIAALHCLADRGLI